MFDLNRRYNRPIVPPIVPPIEDQTCTLQSIIPTADLSKIDRRGHRSPSGYGPLGLFPDCLKGRLFSYWCFRLFGRGHTKDLRIPGPLFSYLDLFE